MSSSLNSPPRGRFSLSRWLTDTTPRFFDRALQNLGLKQFKWLVLLLLLLSVPLIITPLRIWQQAVIALFLVIIGQFIMEAEEQESSTEISQYYHLFMVWLSLVTTLRYLYYRTSYTLNFDGLLNSIACVLLYGAELYAVLTLALAYFQTLRIKERQPVDLATIPQEEWFNVDIYIPTFNEDVEIVRKTALAAIACDYARGKKTVYVLDDGRPERYKENDPRRESFRRRREQIRQMCEDIGCIHMTRDNNNHAKAGNINNAFHKTDGDLVLILDCDHIPSRQFLLDTVGFFFDPKVSFVQTPHWFYNPDPFERNLLTGGRIPAGNELFYKVLQKGNDFWNAAFFCGSAAIIRKSHALEVGGIAVETVTEDCHTALRLHSRGYKSVYYDKIMVAGLAPDTFSSYMGQQVRWARGMAQILRLENPLFNPRLKLTIPQRICYFSATSHFLYGYPRLIYAIVPTLFLLFGINPIRGLGLETLAYAVPHILLALFTNHLIYKNVRFSFWNEIFEFVMAFQSGWVTMLALLNPRLGSFNVTDKGVNIAKRTFDWRSMRGLMVVAALVFTSLFAVPYWLLLRPEDWQAVLVNTLWSGFNLILLIAALLVGFEQPQVRAAHRLQRRLRVVISTTNQTFQGTTVNISETGALVSLESLPNLPDEIDVEIMGDSTARVSLTARVVRLSPVSDTQTLLAIDFVNPSRSQIDNLILVSYSDVREWYSQKRQNSDQPFHSLGFLATSLTRSFRDIKPTTRKQVRKQVNAVGELYWDGHFFSGIATELGVTGLQLEISRKKAKSGERVLGQEDLHKMCSLKPLVGLLLSREEGNPSPSKLLAEISGAKEETNGKIVVDLNFPTQFKQRQSPKIKQLLQVL
ncbi:cellulose synthase catalytic subunit [Scytonema sp. HK-05]|uniref:UDP-forming cellulose synthase catalytic subunit n=1 Tax=Scytonema sp. HK-05 TaxID=1137095 RepID=UPI0009368651|nr:UDP-forming cellulose synthase catalytic subunit [Scytonema sp. HK-05]OKH60439.1 cellulose synthase catalytic subunit (UDP-forming) [Scytonema sp. HK-05]BAY44764.1 cellulose synthase catalytic subunit [Scytonema sp. HK-05]